MAGNLCTLTVVVFVALILFSHHLVFAMHGVPTSKGVIAGWAWIEPEALLTKNVPAFVGIAIAISLCHDGGAILRSIADVLSYGRGR